MEKNSKSLLKSAKFLVSATLIGISVGLILSCYRYVVPLLGSYFQKFYTWTKTGFVGFFLFMGGLALVGLVVGLITAWEPKIGGSGIPQVAAQLKGKMKLNWRRVFPAKFTGGLLSLAAGLTVGREGPSVQMGASLADGLCGLVKSKEEDKPFLLVSGAAAGLATAFHAPLSGIIFALEELHKNIKPRAFVAASLASICAGVTSSLVLGNKPVMDFGILKAIPLVAYPLLVGLAILIGFLAVIFTRSIARGKKIYKALSLPLYVRVTLAFILTGIFLYCWPKLYGSGEIFLSPMMEGQLGPKTIFLLLLLKFALLLVAFCSGLPGGIFFPLLILGAFVGSLYAQAAVALGILDPTLIPVFTVLAMTANFSAIVRSPLTGIALIAEMTGSFTYFLPLCIVSFTSYLTAELLGLPPVYDLLLEMQLADAGQSERKA